MVNEKVISSWCACMFATPHCFLVDVLLQRARREPAAVVNGGTKLHLDAWHAPLYCMARLHALGTTGHVAMDGASCDRGMCHSAFVEVLHGDDL